MAGELGDDWARLRRPLSEGELEAGLVRPDVPGRSMLVRVVTPDGPDLADGKFFQGQVLGVAPDGTVEPAGGTMIVLARGGAPSYSAVAVADFVPWRWVASQFSPNCGPCGVPQNKSLSLYRRYVTRTADGGGCVKVCSDIEATYPLRWWPGQVVGYITSQLKAGLYYTDCAGVPYVVADSYGNCVQSGTRYGRYFFGCRSSDSKLVLMFVDWSYFGGTTSSNNGLSQCSAFDPSTPATNPPAQTMTTPVESWGTTATCRPLDLRQTVYQSDGCGAFLLTDDYWIQETA